MKLDWMGHNWTMKDVWWDYGFSSYFLSMELHDLTWDYRHYHRIDTHGSVGLAVDIFVLAGAVALLVRGTVRWRRLRSQRDNAPSAG